MILTPLKNELILITLVNFFLLLNILISFYNLFVQEGRGHWTVDYTGTQSFKGRFSHSLV